MPLTDRWSNHLRRTPGPLRVPTSVGAKRRCSPIQAIVLACLIATVGCLRSPQSQATTATANTKNAQETSNTEDAQRSQTDKQNEASTTSTVTESKQPNSSASTATAARSSQAKRDAEPSSTARDSTTANHSSSPNTADNESKGKTKKSADPEATRKNVAALRQKADQAKLRNDPGNAFRLTVAAWDEARLHPKDTGLRTATEELAAEIKTLSQQANQKHDAASDASSTLVEK